MISKAHHATKAALAGLRSDSIRSAGCRHGYDCTARIEHLSLPEPANRGFLAAVRPALSLLRRHRRAAASRPLVARMRRAGMSAFSYIAKPTQLTLPKPQRALLARRSWRITLCSSATRAARKNIHAQHRSIAPRPGNEAR